MCDGDKYDDDDVDDDDVDDDEWWWNKLTMDIKWRGKPSL